MNKIIQQSIDNEKMLLNVTKQILTNNAFIKREDKDRLLHKWLKTKVNDKHTTTVFDESGVKNYINADISYLDKYYGNNNDIDIELIDSDLNFMACETDKQDDYNETYHDMETNLCRELVIYKGTNHYHTHYLFNNMIDYVYEHDMHYTIPKFNAEGQIVMSEYILIDVETDFKKKFYEFCFDNSD